MGDEELELGFISGSIFEKSFPKDKAWLLKYFKREWHHDFVKYFLIFNDYKYFMNRTGHFAYIRTLLSLIHKINLLLAAHSKAKKTMDLETLTKIETGKYKWGSKK